jgi:hypothetical protein
MPKKQSPSVSPRATNQLVTLVRTAASSTSRFEDRYWEGRIESLIHKHLAASQDDVIEAALDELASADPDQADDLLEHVQSASQALNIEVDGQPWQVLLVTSALAVWTRYQLPQVDLSDKMVDFFTDGLKQHVLAPDVKVGALPKLVGIDEMPRSFGEIYQWLQRLANRTLGKRAALPSTITIEPNPALLVDTRHLVLAVAVRAGEPLFRWQSDVHATQERCLEQWTKYVTPALSQLLPGCQFHALLPQSYHASIELSEQHVRIVAIHSASQWLNGALNLKPGELRATIAAVGERDAQEYRIGFHRDRQQDVIYGTIWPVFDQYGSGTGESIIDVVDEIAAVLKDSGVNHIKRIPGILLPESCEDCSAPLFPNPAGELVHVELPEEAFDAPQHFH